ncbi:alginate export family protein [bacterium]|nr:alginate export family protein [bacterium]
MKRLRFTAALGLVFILLSIHSELVSAQMMDKLSVTGQLRHRSEYSAKDFDANTDNPFYSLLRTRLNVGVQATEDVKVFVQFQDSRTWGGENPAFARGTMDGSAPLFDVHQAYFNVTNAFGSGFSATLGRQEINVGNQRLVGAVGWHNVGRSFDAIRLGYQLDKGNVDFFAARLIGVTGTPVGDNLFGAVGTFPVNKDNRFQLLFLADNSTNPIGGGPDEGENKLQRYTTGAALNGSKSPLDYELEGYYQMGHQLEAATGRLGSIGAYLASARLNFLVNDSNGLKLGALFTLVSGDSDASDGEVKNFDTLFATNHKFYGFMDYFVGAGTFAKGLQDIGLAAAMKANDKTSLALDLHHFTAPQMTSGSDSVLGQEVDFTLTYKYNAALNLTGGLSAFMPGNDFGGEDIAYWGYLSTSVVF